jgi:hypothetical protein
VAKWNAEAQHDKKEYPETFRNHRRHEYDRAYRERSLVAGPFVCILRTQFIDAGGAHPNHDVNTILWDAKARKRISIRPFFDGTRTNGPTMRRPAKAIRAAVVAAKKARGMRPTAASDPTWLGGIKPNLTKIGGVALALSTERGKSAGLIVSFSPCAVGSYAEGSSYVVFVPWTVFKAGLFREGRAIFGGRRQKDDRRNDING